VFGGLLILSSFYSALSPWQAGVLALAWLLAAGWLPMSLRRKPGWVAAARTIICAITLLSLVALSAHEFIERERQEQESANPYDQYL
jgi:hypothetical protein